MRANQSEKTESIMIKSCFVTLSFSTEPVTITSSLQSTLFFHYYKEHNAKGLRVRFGKRLPDIYIQKFSSKFGKFSEIDLRFNEMERIYQSLTFLVNYVNSFPLIYPSLAVNWGNTCKIYPFWCLFSIELTCFG